MNAERAYLFRHALLRDAAYQLQLPGDRARLHGLAVELIEDLTGGRAPEPLPLGTADPPPFVPHPSDVFAEELAEHAAMAPGGEMRRVRKLYLRRGGEYVDRQFGGIVSERLWQQHAELAEGVEKGESLRRAAEAARGAGRLKAAETLMALALSVHRAAGDRRFEGVALEGLATLYHHTGRIPDAERSLEQARELHRESGNRRSVASADNLLASLYQDTARVAEAERGFEQSVAIFREIQDRRAEGIVLGNLANLYNETGRPQQAGRCYAQALVLHREVGDRRSEGIQLCNLAGFNLNSGDAGQAELCFHQALAIHREFGHRLGEGIVLDNLAVLFQLSGRLEQAEIYYNKAIAIASEVNAPASVASATGNLASLYHLTGRLEESDLAFQKALAIHHRLGNRRYEGIVLCDYARLLLAERDVERARAVWEKGAAILRELSDFQELERKAPALREACAGAGVPAFDGPVL